MLGRAAAARRIANADRYFTPAAGQLTANVSILDGNPENQRDENDNQSILNQALTIFLNYQAL
jgi:hypothetical protein